MLPERPPLPAREAEDFRATKTIFRVIKNLPFLTLLLFNSPALLTALCCFFSAAFKRGCF